MILTLSLTVVGLILIGLYGLLAVRNLFKLIITLQILVKGAVLALVIAGETSGRLQLGQSLAVTVIVADTVVAVIALALAVQLKQQSGTVDVGRLDTLKG
ncbi:MAG: NADH-quinone oxidoreductase subunit K [Anaerolineae bacterium]|nr:NADH-quinone oxidoreductase subunit K [Anaerolineae bacterium]